jgi:hypothetical protein
MARIICIGEAMLELSSRAGACHLGYGGDTLNTAIHLARLGHDVAYLTALGADPFSADLRSKWADEGLDTSLILTDTARNPGLYAISVDHAGERSFTYWRNDSAARQMFALPEIERVLAEAIQADLLVYSLITLAVLPALATHRGEMEGARESAGRAAGAWRSTAIIDRDCGKAPARRKRRATKQLPVPTLACRRSRMRRCSTARQALTPSPRIGSSWDAPRRS